MARLRRRFARCSHDVGFCEEYITPGHAYKIRLFSLSSLLRSTPPRSRPFARRSSRSAVSLFETSPQRSPSPSRSFCMLHEPRPGGVLHFVSLRANRPRPLARGVLCICGQMTRSNAMETDTPWLDCADLLIQLRVLCERSRALRAAYCAQRDAARAFKSPWPHSAALLPEELYPLQPILEP